MAKDEMSWLHSNKCKYCGCELGFRTGSERIICKRCKKINYKNKKVKFENELRKQMLKRKKEK